MEQAKKQQNKLYGEDDGQYQTQKEGGESLAQKNEKKRKRRRRVKKHRHPPQYYEELKREKQKRKREEEWNDRFNLGSIPNMFEMQAKGGGKKLRMKSLKKFNSTKQKEIIYRTFEGQSHNQTKSKPSKSFNIRIMSKKQQKDQAKKNLSTDPKSPQQPATTTTKQQQQQQKQKTKEQLIQQVLNTHQQLKFSQCHKDLLIDIIKNSNEKTLISFIHAQIAKIKGKTSLCTMLQTSIEKREGAIGKLREFKENMTADNIKKYRLVTLRVIEQVLQWKQQFENSYQELTKIKPKLAFTVDGQNYLQKISKCFKLDHTTQTQLQGNPFLLGLDDNPIDNELLVKIRACEMLLLENDLDMELA